MSLTLEVRICLEFQKIRFLKVLTSLHDPQITHFLEMDLKEPYHDVKGKGLPTAQKALKINPVDGRG